MFRMGLFLLILVASARTDAEKGILIPRPAAVDPADWDGQFKGGCAPILAG